MQTGTQAETATTTSEAPKRPGPIATAQNKAAERAAFLAEMNAASEAKAEVAPKPAAEPEKKAVEAEADDTDEDPKKVEPKDDADTDKRLDKVKRAEKKMRQDAEQREREQNERIEARERELQRREQKMEQEREADRTRLAEFDKIKERVRYAPGDVLRALGIPDEDHEEIGKLIYHEAAGIKDPKHKAEAARLSKEREGNDRVAKLEKKLAEMEEEKKTAAQRAEQEKAAEQYLDKVAKAATDETPLVQIWLEKSPQRARAAMYQIADHMARKAGGIPDEEDVLAELEKWRRQELEDNDADVESIIAKHKAKGGGKPAEKKPAETARVVSKTTKRDSRTDRDGLLQELAAFRSGT